MAGTAELELENVGAYLGKHKFTFKKGINIVKAPNATGKTSLIKGLELLVLSKKGLKGKGHYMNFYVGVDEQALVKLKNESGEFERKFRRVGNDLFDTDGDPMVIEGDIIDAVCFAVPENEVIKKFISKEPIDPYIERFAGIRYYKDALKHINIIKDNYERELRRFDNERIRLEEAKESLEIEKKNLEDVEEKYRNLPDVPIDKLSKDEETRKNLREIERKRGEIEGEKRKILSDIEDSKEKIERLTREIKDRGERLKEIGKTKKDLKREIETRETEIIKLKKEKNEIDSTLNTLERDRSLTKENIEAIRLEGVLIGENKRVDCHACGRPLSFKELKERENKLKRAIDDYDKKRREINRAIEGLKDEIRLLERDISELENINKELGEKQRSLAYIESTLKDKTKRMTELEGDLKELEKEMKKLAGSIDENLWKKKQEKDRLRGKVDVIRNNIDRLKKEISKLQETLSTAGKIGEKYKAAKEIETHLEMRANELKDAVAETFEKRAKEIYKSLGFSDFVDIRVDRNDYTVDIRREGYGEEWDIEALSTSERLTLGVVFLISAKEEYFPDFPFFILDELVTSYDPERFEKLTEYVGTLTDYVIITKLADERESGKKVIIEYAKA